RPPLQQHRVLLALESRNAARAGLDAERARGTRFLLAPVGAGGLAPGQPASGAVILSAAGAGLERAHAMGRHGPAPGTALRLKIPARAWGAGGSPSCPRARSRTGCRWSSPGRCPGDR